MSRFSVLFFEDVQSDKARVLSALENEGIFYSFTDNWQDAEKYLKNEQYDLVIADTFIYENRMDSDLKSKSGNPGEFDCLPFLFEVTESADPPIPVVIYTGQNTILSVRSYIDRIVDFWNKKQVIDPDFISFRIRKIRDLIEFERPSSPLIKSLKSAQLEKKDSPWKAEIDQILNEYESYSTALDQGLIVQSPLTRIASSLGFSGNFKKGFNVALRSDSPISITLGSRPHFHHSINCFLLGYYLLNLAGIDWIGIFKNDSKSYFSIRMNSAYSSVPSDVAEKKVWQEINNSWFTASLLHDCTSLIQRFPKISSEFTKLTDTLNLCQCSKFDADPSVKGDLCSLATTRYKSTDSKLGDYISKISEKLDHGYLSGVFLLTHCYDEILKNRKDVEALIPAAEAVFLHNFVTRTDFPVITFNVSPIAGLLIFCDAIQSWKRDLPENELELNDIITKAELTELSSSIGSDGNPQIKLKVRYLPPAFIAKHKQTIDKNEILLLDVLQRFVKDPIRQKLNFNFNDDARPDINIKFYVGHKKIEELDIPEIDY